MVADRGPQFAKRCKTLIIEIDDMKLHSYKTQLPAIRNSYTDRQPTMLNDLLLHALHSNLAIFPQCSRP
jgi:hypothetical protein